MGYSISFPLSHRNRKCKGAAATYIEHFLGQIVVNISPMNSQWATSMMVFKYNQMTLSAVWEFLQVYKHFLYQPYTIDKYIMIDTSKLT